MLNEQGKETKDSVIETAALRFEKLLTKEVAGLRNELSERISSVEIRLGNKITTEITDVREELSGQISKVDTRITTEISGLRVDLTEKIQKSKTDTIKWMFLFYIGQVGALAGILFVVLK